MKKLLLIIVLSAILTGTQNVQAQRLQAVHGAADPQLAVVDVWIGISILPPIKLDDIAFKAAARPLLSSSRPRFARPVYFV